MRIRHLRFQYLWALLPALAVIVNAGCGESTTPHTQAAAVPPPTVVLAEVQQRTVPIYSEYVGQTRATETVELRARVEGVLQKIYFGEGQAVRRGELLFTIDKSTYLASLQTAKALLAKAEADLAQARQRTDVLKAQAEVADAEAIQSKTQQDLARLKPLAKEKAVTELELDAAVAAEKSANAQVESRKANLANTEGAVKYTVDRAAAEVSAAKARVTQAQLDLGYCDIYSPIDGIIGFKNVDVGNFVGRGEATLLATVSSSQPLLVDFNLGETEFLTITGRGSGGRPSGGRGLELILANDTTHPYPGVLKVLDRTVDPQTGTLKVEAMFSNPGSHLRPGQFARIRAIVSERQNAILVPARAVQDMQGAKTVFVIDGQNKASVRTITIGEQSDDNLIVLQGLNPGERVVVEGIQKVRPGSEVKPVSADQTSEVQPAAQS